MPKVLGFFLRKEDLFKRKQENFPAGSKWEDRGFEVNITFTKGKAETFF